MGKLFHKLLLISIITATLFSISVPIYANAERTPLFVGDVTQDHHISMDDVVTLQKYLAKITEISKRGLVAADVNADSNINLEDVTIIQKKLARLIHTFGNDYILGTHVEARTITADILSGKAIAGESVKFSVDKANGYAPLNFEFFVNDVIVREYGESNSFEYKFDRAGEYKITAKVYNGFDESVTLSLDYKVLELVNNEKPAIKSLDFDDEVIFKKTNDKGEIFQIYVNDDDIKVTANAYMGNAPYEYMFLLDDQELTDGYTTTNSVSISRNRPVGTTNILTVKIKDKNGIEASENFKLYFIGEPKV